ncbi:acyltransferase family protein [Bradyrhizobium genosp. A]|uniref:acyltransferase family protein n=1 Tax=Bradyrhizobium genosp. A TaxID=83626 RepID=UPI003CEA7EE3
MTSKGELIGLQYLRGIAASIVVLHHLCYSNTDLGPFGVKIFFVLSGFVMWFTTSSSDVSPVVFWRLRIARIVPLYWLFLSLLVAVALAPSNHLNTTELTTQNVILSFLFIPHFHQVQRTLIAPILIPGWSLNYEMFFYLLFGVALLIKPRPCRALFIGGLLWSLVLLGMWLAPSTAILSTYTNPALLLFLGGVLLAMIYQKYRVEGAMLGLILIFAGILLELLGVPYDTWHIESFLGIAAVLIVAGVLAIEPTLRRAPINLLRSIGDASYSIYLSHLFFLRLFEVGWRHVPARLGSGFVEFAFLALSFTLAVAGGVAVHYSIERPMVRLFRVRLLADSVRTPVAGI